jgi:hypothetical protein
MTLNINWKKQDFPIFNITLKCFVCVCCIGNTTDWRQRWFFQTMNGFFTETKIITRKSRSMAFWQTVERGFCGTRRAHWFRNIKENLLSNDQSMETFSIHLISVFLYRETSLLHFLCKFIFLACIVKSFMPIKLLWKHKEKTSNVFQFNPRTNERSQQVQ